MPSRSSLRPEDARRSNLSLILQTLIDKPGQSRADLARATGLTKVTVSDLVSELISNDLVTETGPASAARPGKPSTALAFNAGARDVIAIDLSARDRVRGAVLSLAGDVITRLERPLDGAVSDAAQSIALELAEDLVRAAQHPILGLGVGSPGTVNRHGVVLSAPNLHWHDRPLQEDLAAALRLPVVVQNDANVAVLAERRFANGSGNVVRIQLARGVGAGLLVGGHLVYGAASDAGEIGHVVIDPTGAECTCGKTGCLETVLSAPALNAAIDAAPAQREHTLAAAGRRLGIALAPVVGMLGLTQIVIGGPAPADSPELLDGLRAELVARTRSDFRPELDLSFSTLGSDAVLLGAAALVLLSELGIS